MENKTVVITGANSGIGEASARILAERGATVVLLCRDVAKGEEAVGRIGAAVPGAKLDLYRCDLANFASIRQAAQGVLNAHPQIDVLLNNAGIYTPQRRLTVDGLETTVQTNHFGPFLLTRLLEDRLVESAPARIVNVSSEAHRGSQIPFEDLQFEGGYRGFEVYGISKLMNVLHARALSRRLDATKVTANSLHPGVVATGFAQDEKSVFGTFFRMFRFLLISSDKGAATSVYLCSESEGGEVSGKYFSDRKQKTPSAAALDDESAERLWTLSEAIVNR